MANRNFFRKQAMEREVKELYVEASIGASGAPTLVKKLGIASMVRNSVGRYTVTLEDKYNALLQITESRQLASGSPAAVGGMVVRSEDVGGAKTVVIEFVDETGAPVELVNGTVLRLKMDLKNTSVVR